MHNSGFNELSRGDGACNIDETRAKLGEQLGQSLRDV